MKVLLSSLLILAYVALQASTEHSTRERIALHKKWLQLREARRKLLLDEHQAPNITDEKWWYYGYYKYDLNSTSPVKKSRRKPLNLDVHLKSKRRKEQQIQTNSLEPIETNILISTSTTIPEVTSLPTTSAIEASTTVASTTIETTAIAFTSEATTPATLTLETSTLETSTAPISKSTRQFDNRNDSTLDINSTTEINDRMNLNQTITQATEFPTTTTTTTTTEHSIPYNVTVDRTRVQTVKRVRPRKLSNAVWGRWQKWTTCSRTCGGGVMSQYRPCISRDPTLKNRTSNECIGLQKRFRICNEQSCPDHELDFREQQCVYYNNQSFHSKTYSWESYVVDEAECELNCKPVGMNYFAMLKDRVIDGTSCLSPVDFVKQNHSGRAMCVEGICKAIHNSGILAGAFLNNGAVRCGSTVCNHVSKTFDENPLPIGYNNIATIPAGASNISILELKNSDNYLVLKRDHTFIINGDNIISDSGIFKAAGTVFDYRRIDDAIETSDDTEGVTEWITSSGPIREPIHLMILSQSQNPGIRYEYLIPINPIKSPTDEIVRSVEMEADMPPDSENSKQTDSDKVIEKRKKKNSFVWRVVSFSTCSKSCGGGTYTPIIRCVREGTGKFYAHKRCANQTKPVLNEHILRCNAQPCPAYWKLDEWSACNCGLPNEHDYQTRTIKCVQELSTGDVIHVHDSACLEKLPEKRQECNCPKKQVAYYRNPHKNHHHHHHNQHAAPITLIGNSTIGKKAHILEGRRPGNWLTSDWNEKCSTKCGEGTQYRSIFCDRSTPKSDRCDIRLTPDITKSCTETAQCSAGDWFLGPWSECFGDCFNLMRSRSVLCIKDDQIVGDALCMDSNSVENTTKPATIEKCELSKVSYCKPKWHYSDWTECTRSCGSGTQRRIVKCFEPDDKETLLKESDNCRYAERPAAFRSCNTHDCGEDESAETTEPATEAPTTKKVKEPKVRLIQNDSTPKCEDRFANCLNVVQARLCTYDYYIENCCASCKEAIERGY